MLSFPLVGPVARRGYLLGAVTDDGVSIKVSLVVSDQRLHSSAGNYPTAALTQASPVHLSTDRLELAVADGPPTYAK